MLSPTNTYFRPQKSVDIMAQDKISSPVGDPLSPQFTLSIDTDSSEQTISMIFRKSLTNGHTLPKTPHNSPVQGVKIKKDFRLDIFIPQLNLDD